MPKVTLNDLTNLQNETSAVNTINSNSAAIEAAIENTLSRDGTSPNEMNANLDMNNYRVFNLPAATTPTEPIRKMEFDDMVGEIPNARQHAQEAKDARDAAQVAEAGALEAETFAYRWASENEDTPVDDGIRTGYSSFHWSAKSEDHATDSENAKIEAQVARDFARDWATEAEDVPVDDGVNPPGFSAYHWAQKAEAIAVGDLDASSLDYDNTDSGLAATNVQDAIDETNDRFLLKTVANLPGGPVVVERLMQDKLSEFVSVKDFGAVGDGVTDDTAAFQAAAAYFGSGGVLATANGGVLLVPKGLYKITGQTLFQQTGVRVIGEGQEATKIIVAADLGNAAVFKFDQTRTDYSMVGVGVENLRINMNGFTGHGIYMLKPYDGVSLRNLFVDNVADGYSGYRIGPDPDNTADTISQTLLLENCIAIHKNATATEPLFYISNLQEAVLTGCKAFGTYDSNGKAACYPFEFVDCRGITLNGCSSAFASKHGVKITVLTRPSTGILIANHTFETIDGAVRADGLAGIGEVIDLSVINPRTEGGVTNASGAFDLNRVYRSSIDAGSLTVNIDADSIANIVLSENSAQVTNAGTATTILGAASQADTLYKIIAGGLRVSNAAVKHIETSNTAVQLYSSGSISVQADYPFGASQTGVLLAVNRGGTVSLSRVEIGGPDTGGVGFRMLRVAN